MNQLKPKCYYVEKYVNDQNVLMNLAIGRHNSIKVSETALKKITNQEILKNIIFKLNDDDWKTKLNILDQITDEVILFEIAAQSSDIDVKFKAAEKIKDPKIILRLILDIRVSNESLLEKLINKITDNEDLKLIALTKNIQHPINIIEDEEVLTDIAIELEKTHYAETLLKKIQEEDNINKIALHARLPQIRKAALAKVTDIEVLESVVKFEKEPEIIACAIKKLVGKDDFLCNLLSTSNNNFIIKSLLETLDADNIPDKTLQRIVLTSNSEDCRVLALLKISSKDCLEYILNNTTENDWYIQAICKDILEEMSSN